VKLGMLTASLPGQARARSESRAGRPNTGMRRWRPPHGLTSATARSLQPTSMPRRSRKLMRTRSDPCPTMPGWSCRRWFDGVLSVEHEDPVWGGSEDRIEAGLEIARRTLRPLIIQ
jgi:hypothetical protein